MRIGDYEVLGELGRGGMGAVYRAAHPEVPGLEVAVKVLLGADAPARLRRFEREARALTKLRHPNVVTLYGTGSHEGKPFIAMQLVQGEALSELLERDGPLPQRRVAEIGTALASALHCVHAEGVLHRDVKPANVLMSDAGEVLLTDFGLVTDFDGAASRLTVSGVMLGTPGFLPPEQATGERVGVGPRSDIYGLGATLYAALTGRPPIEGTTLAEVAIATCAAAPVPPSQHRPDLDPELEGITLRCLEKEPEDRFATAAALADRLDAWLRGDVLEAAPLPPREANWVLPVLGTVLLLVTLGVGGLALSRRGQSESRPVDRAVALSEEGARRFEDGDAQAAIELYGEAIALRPDLVKPWWNRGIARAALGDSQGAIGDWTHALELDPKRARLYAERAFLRAQGGDFEGALTDYRACLDLEPGYQIAWVNLAALHLELGRLEEAVSALDRAIELGPSATDHLVRGQTRRGLGDLDGALADFSAALELDPSCQGAVSERGSLRLSLDLYDGAREDLNRALALDSKDLRAAHARAKTRLKLGDRLGALADMRRALELDPEGELADQVRRTISQLEAQLAE